ncbi:MAG: S41 family peptidase [Pseudomonadota bacterium]
MNNPVVAVVTVAACFILSACGGGGGSPGTCVGSAAVCSPSSSAPGLPPAVGEATFAASTTFAGQCQRPRPATAASALTGELYNDLAGSLTTEMNWIRSFVNETYLWYDEVPTIDLGQYAINATVPFYEPANNQLSQRLLATDTDVTEAFFNSQRTPLFTPSGKPKDRFHFTYPTGQWEALQVGQSVGYGFEAALLAPTPPRKIIVAFAAPGSVAAANQITRGTEFVSVDGVDVVNGSPVATINEGLFAPVAGKRYTFEVLDPGSSVRRTVSMTAGPTTSVPVQNVTILPTPTGSVGYLLFNDHIVTAESQLVNAFNQFTAADGGTGVRDLVVDLRYNGGGLLRIASRLGYMIAGSAVTSGKTFERLRFNRKNPFGLTAAEASTPFISTSDSNAPLPQLALPRVFVLTSGSTCSASEALINGLRGAGVEVIQIGSTTCGKPYGFFPEENCGTTYFAVQLEGVNHLGFGDYPDGFVPDGNPSLPTSIPGCVVADDFSRQLGDPMEARLAAALQYRIGGICPIGAVSVASKQATRAGAETLTEPQLVRSPLRENRWLAPRSN